MRRVAQLDDAERNALLRGDGLRFTVGGYTYRLRTRLPDVVRGFGRLYGGYPLDDGAAPYADFHVVIDRGLGIQRRWRPMSSFALGAIRPFGMLGAGQGIPVLEWGLNYCVSQHAHQYLVLHAAVLERGGRALVMPAPSGSGKSTLCAALVLDGWRLLSDELALIDPATRRVVPNPRPVSLKNQSIALVERRGAGRVRYGSVVHDTVKGTIAHFPAPTDAIDRAGDAVPIGWLVTPRFAAGAVTQWHPTSRGTALDLMLRSAFNQAQHQRGGFELLCDLAESVSSWELVYSDLDDVLPTLAARAAEPVAPGAAA